MRYIAYYGNIFLPSCRFFPLVLNTLSKLIKVYEEHKSLELYPSHRRFPCDKNLLVDLYNGIQNIKNIWETRQKNEIFNAYYVEDEKFRYYVM